jgi:DNA invertase Pin-like site-specific DNA recombinase
MQAGPGPRGQPPSPPPSTAQGQADCDEVYIDKASGKLASRPELDKALERLRPGDTLAITWLSRAMRSLRHLLELAAGLQARGVHLQVLKQGMDTTTPQGRIAEAPSKASPPPGHAAGTAAALPT